VDRPSSWFSPTGSHIAIDNQRSTAMFSITRRITTPFAVALALGTCAAPALARPYDLDSNGSYVPAVTASTPASTPPTIVRVTAPSSGFDWGDAGIGAAGGLVLSAIGLGTVLGMSQRRTRRTRHTTPLPG
jgi:hypothetical protein